MLKKLFFLAFIMMYLLGIYVGISCGLDEANYPTTGNGNNPVIALLLKSDFERFTDIATNNIIVGLKSFVLGCFSVGVLSAIYLFYNGFVSGIVIGKTSEMLTWKSVLGSTLPHCPEIIGLALMSYLGFALSTKVLFKTNYIRKGLFFLLFVVAIIIIVFSAFIESYVSMHA